MFRFEHAEWLWICLLPLVFIAGLIVRTTLRRRDWSGWGSTSTINRIRSGVRSNQWSAWILIGCILILCIAAINPQWGTKAVTVDDESIQLQILLDISTSMLAEDVPPNRFDRARRLALDIAEEFRAEDIGLIVFAGSAYVQSPITSDWRAIQLFLNVADPSQAGTQGTDIGEAIALVNKSAEELDNPDAGAIILITDGEDHKGEMITEAQKALESGWRTYVVGVGTPLGATIPVWINNQRDVKRDESGQPVRTILVPEQLLALAEAGNGKYYEIQSGREIIDDLRSELSTLARQRAEQRTFTEHKSYFQWFLLPAILILSLLAGVQYKRQIP